MTRKGKIVRVHTDLANEIDAIWKENRQQISKVQVSREIANVVREQRNSGIEVNMWPLPGKRLIKKRWGAL